MLAATTAQTAIVVTFVVVLIVGAFAWDLFRDTRP